MQKHDKRVIKLVNILLTGWANSSAEAGWLGDSMLGRVIDFGGSPPAGSGQDQSNAQMIQALQHYRENHHDFHAMEQAFWRICRKPGDRRHIMAILCRHYYHGINPRTDQAYTEGDRIMHWVEHLNRHPWQDMELLALDCYEDLRKKFRYGVQRGAPKLIKAEMGLS